MKKTLKTIEIIIGLPILAFIINLFVQFGYCLITSNSIKSLNTTGLKENLYLLVVLSDFIMLLILFLIFRLNKKNFIEKLNFKKIKFKESLYIIILGIGISIVLLFLAGTLSKIIPSYNVVQNNLEIARNSLIQIVSTVILVPIYEEIIFRGIIFGYLKKNYNTSVAIILQAVIFGITHLNVVQGIYTFLLALVLALVYIYSDSILGSIIVHIIFNLLGIDIIPKIIEYNRNFISIILILGIVLSIFGAVKIIGKYDDILYK